VPKNIPATKNANRIIRNGVVFIWLLFLPTPITACNASLIKREMYLNTLRLTLSQILLLGLLLV
jgi:hypothetical protein